MHAGLGTRALAASYSAQDREVMGLLLLPFLIVATAIGLNQSVRQAVRYSDLVAMEIRDAQGSAPSVSIARAEPRSEVPKSEAPRIAVPPEAIAKPAVTASSRETVALAPPPVIAPPLPQSRAPETPRYAAVPPGDTEAHKAPGVCVAKAREDGAPVIHADTGAADGATFGRRLAAAALAQIDDFVVYDDSYRPISYPLGDIPAFFGVCTDVVIRAYRQLGIDLQVAVHKARVGSGDTNIDHRRTEVLKRLFAAQGETLPISAFPEDYLAGDIVTYYRPHNRGSRAHIAIVSDVMAASGRPMIIHNRGWGPQLEDALFVDEITGHYRYSDAAKIAQIDFGAQSKRAGISAAPLVRASFRPDGTAISAP